MIQISKALSAHSGKKIMIVDLANFSHYPTMSVGYLSAICRKAGFDVDVYSPLMIGLKGYVRERRPGRLSLPFQKLNYRVATSNFLPVRRMRRWVAARRNSSLTRKSDRLVSGFRERFSSYKPDLVLVSSYLMYREQTAQIAGIAKAKGIPVLVGGPYFAQPDVAREWTAIDGVAGIVGGELELDLPMVLEMMLDGRSLADVPGIWTLDEKGNQTGAARPPMKELDAVPFPDYSAFPWTAYPSRIVSILTGRGCGWGACNFCSDIHSTIGRTYRSRSLHNVLDEIRHHHEYHGVDRFVFTDLKLNSNLSIWYGILEHMQDIVPGARWIGAVHVDMGSTHNSNNGLSKTDLKAAVASGCVRLTTGLESGSQEVLDAIKKGATLETTSRYLHDATEAGISTRCTVINGYPTEKAGDVRLTSKFLRDHFDVIERVNLCPFHIVTGTILHRSLQKSAQSYPDVQILDQDPSMAWIEHRYAPVKDRIYRASVMDLLAATHAINRKELKVTAQEFEGVM